MEKHHKCMKHFENILRIFYLWPHPLPDHFNRAMYQHALCLARKHQVFFIGRKSKLIPAEIRKQVKWIGIPGGKMDSVLYFLSVIALLLGNLRHRQNTIVYTFNEETSYIGLVSKLLGFKWVVDIWDDPALPLYLRNANVLRMFRARLRLYFFKRFAKVSDMVISAIMPEVLSGYYIDKKKICVVSNGVDYWRTRKVALATKALAHDINKVPSKIIVGYVGPVREERGISLLIESVARAQRNCSFKFRLVLIGPVAYEYYNKIISLAYELGIALDVLGERSHQEALSMLNIVDVAVHFYERNQNYEHAYPIKVFEYMALGKPVIAVDSKAMRHIITNGVNGFLVNSVEEAADCLKVLATSPGLRQKIGNNALKTAQENDWSKICVKMLACLNNLRGE